MTHLEIAQMIANKIDSKSQEEINAMMEIVCETHGIKMSWLFPVVGNLYAKITPSVLLKTEVNHYYSEASAR